MCSSGKYLEQDIDRDIYTNTQGIFPPARSVLLERKIDPLPLRTPGVFFFTENVYAPQRSLTGDIRAFPEEGSSTVPLSTTRSVQFFFCTQKVCTLRGGFAENVRVLLYSDSKVALKATSVSSSRALRPQTLHCHPVILSSEKVEIGIQIASSRRRSKHSLIFWREVSLLLVHSSKVFLHIVVTVAGPCFSCFCRFSRQRQSKEMGNSVGKPRRQGERSR